MDYDKIEQMIRRYWSGETDIEEENLLKAFFSEQDDLPENLEKWRRWFSKTATIGNARLGDDFDARMLDLITPKNRVRIRYLRPLTAAVASIILLIVSVSGWQIMRYSSHKRQMEEMTLYKGDYERIKQALYMTSEKMNAAEELMQVNFNNIDRMNEIINIQEE